MSYKSIQLLVNVSEEPHQNSAIDYAIEFVRQYSAHLSVLEIAQLVDLPVARILPLADAIVDEINDERLGKAKVLGEHIETSARVAGVTVDRAVVQLAPRAAREAAVAAARLCDLVIVAKPQGALLTEQKLIEEVLFGSGRPVLVVPPDWKAGPTLDTVVVAWDGGARAARAVGDAMHLLEKAKRVEVVCATSDARDARGVELAQRLSRHCADVSVTILPLVAADAGRTLMQHLSSMPVSLLVMGAFAHARMVEYIIGGTTNLMLNDARVPVLYSF